MALQLAYLVCPLPQMGPVRLPSAQIAHRCLCQHGGCKPHADTPAFTEHLNEVGRPRPSTRFLEDNLKSKEYEIVRLRAALPSGGGGNGSSTDTAAALSGSTADGSAAGGREVGSAVSMASTTHKTCTLPFHIYEGTRLC